jgi:NADH-quinone oxidoreductase subunit C/D
VCIAANLVDMGGLTNYWYLYNEKEAAYDFISRLTGARLTSSFTRIGGMYRDFYEGWEADLEAASAAIEKGVGDALKLVETNRIVHDRTQGVCVLPADRPQLRLYRALPAGQRRSLRPAQGRPLLQLRAFDFEVPVGTKGDIYDRFMIRFEEMFQSISIIRQAMKIHPQKAR